MITPPPQLHLLGMGNDTTPEKPAPKRRGRPKKSASKKAHLGTLGRGRKPAKEPDNPKVREAYLEALAGSKFPSLRQWAIACGIPYDTFVKYSRGSNLPPLDVAADIARIAETSLDQLYGFMTRCGHTNEK